MKTRSVPWIAAVVVWLLPPTAPAQDLGAPVPPVFEGNWVMEFSNSPKKGEVERMLITLPAKVQSFCNNQPFSPMDSGAPAEGGNWTQRRLPSTSIDAGDFGKLTANGGGAKVKHGYGVLGYWGGTSEVAAAGPDEIRGTWKYNDEGGSTVWRRTKPVIERTRFIGLAETESPPGTVGRMEVAYAPGGGMRGNRPRVAIEVYGKDLWGQQICWIEGTDMELEQPYPIYAKGVPNKPETVIGIHLGMRLWGNLTPGRKRLHVGAIELPFDLQIRDYPEAQKPAVGFVRLSEGKYQVATELVTGDQFMVEVRYEKVPKPAPTEVKVGAADGELREVPVTATESPLVFRSELLRVEAPASKPAQ